MDSVEPSVKLVQIDGLVSKIRNYYNHLNQGSPNISTSGPCIDFFAPPWAKAKNIDFGKSNK